jgi:hypothetical protein
MNGSQTNHADMPYRLDEPVNLSHQERKLLMGGSLRLMLGRIDRGIGVYAEDLIRIASYADTDDQERRGRVA